MVDARILDGQVALVTGGASGIGRATALLYAAAGAAVVVADIDAAGAAETAALIESQGGSASSVQTDVTRAKDCVAMVDVALGHFGRLDVAFNNAGVIGTPGLTAEIGLGDWQRVMDVNLTGVFNCMQQELRAMAEAGAGVIVNTASVMGTIATAGGAAYCAAKHGVIGLTKAAALEYGRLGIRVVSVAPGFIETPMTVGADSVFAAEKLERYQKRGALRRMGHSEEVAELVLWLSSSRAAYVTGVNYAVDGGLTAS
jgi:NAD(P)-dependent dehydrogenase (short-subunit alcohol dehydrogenase family)